MILIMIQLDSICVVTDQDLLIKKPYWFGTVRCVALLMLVVLFFQRTSWKCVLRHHDLLALPMLQPSTVHPGFLRGSQRGQTINSFRDVKCVKLKMRDASYTGVPKSSRALVQPGVFVLPGRKCLLQGKVKAVYLVGQKSQCRQWVCANSIVSSLI